MQRFYHQGFFDKDDTKLNFCAPLINKFCQSLLVLEFG